MRKKSKNVLALLVIVMLIGALLAACGTNNAAIGGQGNEESTVAASSTAEQSAAVEELKPIKMTASFGVGWANGQDGPFDDATAQEIMKITGIEIENIPLGESKEAAESKLNLMLASGDYPELLRMSGTVMSKYIQEGALLPMDSLIEQYGKNIKEQYTDSVLKKYADPNDGKIYYMNNYHGFKSNEGFFSMNIRYDLLKQLNPQIADSHNPITPDQYYELLKVFVEKYPKVDGKNSIPLIFSQDQKFYDGGLGVLGILKAAYGIKEFSVDADQNLKIDIKDPRYAEMLKFITKLNREKLIDTEWPTLKYEVYATKLIQRNVFSSTGAWFEMMGANAEFLKNDTTGEKQYLAYVVAADGVKNPPLHQNSDTGNDSITITKNCKNPERAMMLLDYLASPDGNFLTFWGPKGMLWDVVDGKRVVKQEYVDEYNKDVNAFWTKYKVRLWNIMNAQDLALDSMTFSDGTTFQPLPKVDSAQQRFLEFQKASLVDVCNTSYDGYIYFQNVHPQAGTDEATIGQKFADIKEKELFKIILTAKDDAAVDQGLQALIEKANALGIEKYEKFVTDKFKAKLEKLK